MRLIYTILIAHFVADFICQSDWMAINKSKRWDALGWHVLVYTAVIGLFVSVILPPSPYPYTSLTLFGLWVVMNAGAHFVQDAVTSRINAQLWQANQRHWFFVGIGFDQLVHYITLLLTAQWWLEGH